VKIDNSVKPVGGSAGVMRQKPATSAVAGKTTTASAQVQVSSSGTLQEAAGALANAAVVNPDRVAEIKQAIVEGRFRVNPDRIASGLIDSVRQILSSQR
jgi:negative regulator of flagellin synthesis FlgM